MGLVLLGVALYAGWWVGEHPTLASTFTFSGPALAIAIMIYSFAASVAPVWLLLAPRDYLSAFVKIGVVVALAVGILVSLPPLHMPALTQFTDGTGPLGIGNRTWNNLYTMTPGAERVYNLGSAFGLFGNVQNRMAALQATMGMSESRAAYGAGVTEARAQAAAVAPLVCTSSISRTARPLSI